MFETSLLFFVCLFPVLYTSCSLTSVPFVFRGDAGS